ncbi:hypothetical protein MTO96_008823 [Rhipicephalus appendiculatus]
MSSTSKKHRNFVSEPMAGKSVTELAGIGDALGRRMKDRGFDKDQGRFENWLKDTSGANSKQANDCYRCLRDWSNEFL